MKITHRTTVVLTAALALIPVAAHADMVWPALFLEPRLVSVPIIALGYLVEALVLNRAFAMAWPKALLVSAVVNAISAAIGVIAIPLAGIGWEIFPGILLYQAFNMGTFNPLTWTASLVLATGITTAIEVGCLRWIFKVPASHRTWAIWFLANLVSVGLAFLSFFFAPVDEAHFYRPWLVR
jgi:hypothetical protein